MAFVRRNVLVSRITLFFFYSLLLAISFYCFTGRGSHATLLGIFLVGIALLCAIDRNFFRALRNLYQTHLLRVRQYAETKGDRPPWAAAFWLVGIPTLILSLASGRNISPYDNYGAMLTPASLVQYGTAAITQVLGGRTAIEALCREQFWLVCTPTDAYSAYPSGNLPFVLPIFGVARLLQANLNDHDVLWHLASWSAVWFSVGIVMLVFLTALRAGSVKAAFWASAFLGAGSAVFSTVSQGLWSHNGVTLSLVFSLFLILRPEKLTRLESVLVGVALSLSLAGRIISVVLIIPMILWLAWRDLKAAVVSGLACFVGFLPWAIFYYRIFGHPLGPQFRITNQLPGGFSLSNLPEGAYGLLASPGAGLIIFQPWTLFLLAGIFIGRDKASTSLRPLAPAWELLCVSLFIILWLVMGSWVGWNGQWAWGTRYLTEITPMLALLSIKPIFWLLKKKRQAILWGTMAFSFFVHATYVYGSGGNWSSEGFDEASTPQTTQYREIRLFNTRCLDWRDPAFLYPYYQRLFPPPWYPNRPR